MLVYFSTKKQGTENALLVPEQNFSEAFFSVERKTKMSQNMRRASSFTGCSWFVKFFFFCKRNFSLNKDVSATDTKTRSTDETRWVGVS